MKDKRSLAFAIVFLGVLATPGPELWAQIPDQEDLNLSLQDLFSQIPVVVTASRREQRADETPASVYVITAEDIRQSGAITIPELFRTVPGLSLITTSLGDVGIHLRGSVGFNDNFSDKILVMINGRSVYWDVYGTVYWDLFPISIEEIKQIEVIKSPASSLYGTNAFSGVINFITKTPEENPGLNGKVTLGESNTLITYVGYSKSMGPVCVKTSAEFDQGDEWDAENWTDPHRILRLNGQLEYHFSERSDISVSGGYSGTDRRRMFVDEMAGTAAMAGGIGFARLLYNYNDWKLSFFGRDEFFDVDIPQQGINTSFGTQTSDVDLQKILRFGENGSLTCGGNAKRILLEKNDFFSEKQTQNLYAAFADGEYKPLSWLTLASGLRYDWHPLTEGHFSPRASASVKPHEDHTIRFSWGNAFRNPILLNSYFDLTLVTAYEVPPDHELTLQAKVLGNLDLEPEEVNSYEVSYLAKPFKRLTSTFDFYYRQYTGAFSMKESTTVWYAANEAYPGSPAFRFPKMYTRQFVNGKSTNGWGIETQQDFLAAQWLWLMANYTYQQTNKGKGHITNTGKVLGPTQNTPRHRFNTGFRITRNGVSLQTTAMFSSASAFYVSDGRDGANVTIGPNVLLNTRIGFMLEKTEVGISVNNVLDRTYYEYPAGYDLGMNIPTPSADPLDRKVVVSMKFGL